METGMIRASSKTAVNDRAISSEIVTRPAHGRAFCIQEMFELQAGKTPNAIAVQCGVKTLTYSELNARANRLAHYLMMLKVGPEVPVGLYLERNPLMVVAIL